MARAWVRRDLQVSKGGASATGYVVQVNEERGEALTSIGSEGGWDRVVMPGELLARLVPDCRKGEGGRAGGADNERGREKEGDGGREREAEREMAGLSTGASCAPS